jgi:hypothetical protein
MKKIFLSIIILLGLDFKTIAHIDHYSNFNVLEYELFRNNKLIGNHNYEFLRNDDKLIVKSVINFKITKLGVDIYKYYANSEETYLNGQLFNFSSKTNQNKKEKYVNISFNKKKDELIIDGTSYKGPASKEFIIGTWWNHEIVKAKSQISALSGRIIGQTVTFLGKKKIKIGEKEFNTLHFNFKSSDESLPDSKRLNTDVWYDEKTYLWVKAAFDKTGHWEYRIKDYK